MTAGAQKVALNPEFTGPAETWGIAFFALPDFGRDIVPDTNRKEEVA